MILLNVGSGQRPFPKPWINVEIQEKWKPDVVADMTRLPHEDGAVDIVCLHQVYEHISCHENINVLRETHRVLKLGGSLLIFVPNMRALCQRWLTRQLDTETFMISVYGAFMGDLHDLHRWSYDRESLIKNLNRVKWSAVKDFDWRDVHGALISRDFWVLGMEAVK